MQIVIVILLILLVGLVAAAVWFMFFKKDAPQEQGAPVTSAASVMSVRNADAGGRKLVATFEIDVDDIIGNEPAPFLSDVEDMAAREETDIERFRNPNVPLEERYEIGLSLRERGYKVTLPELPGGEGSADGGQGSGGAGTKNDDEEEGDDIASESDPDALRFILMNPSASDERKAAARARLEELGLTDSDEGTGAGDETPGEEEEEEEKDGEESPEEGGDDYGEQMVDPVTLYEEANGDTYDDGNRGSEEPGAVSTDPEPEEESREETSEASERESVPVEGAAAAEAAPVRVDGDSVIDFNFTEIYDDAEDSRKAVELMSFIARSFQKGLISPELVSFAEDRLCLEINQDFWTPEQRVRAKQRKPVFLRDKSFDNMPLDEFDSFIRGEVASEEAARVAESDETPAEQTATREEESVPEAAVPVPAVEKKAPAEGEKKVAQSAVKRPVSTFFDQHGGKNDLMWARLQRKS